MKNIFAKWFPGLRGQAFIWQGASVITQGHANRQTFANITGTISTKGGDNIEK